MSGSANPPGARTKATKEVSGTGTGPLGVQQPKPKQAPSGSHPAGAASSTPQLVYTTAPPVPGLSCRPKPGRGLACLRSAVWGLGSGSRAGAGALGFKLRSSLDW